jgi:hypothetical protein
MTRRTVTARVTHLIALVLSTGIVFGAACTPASSRTSPVAADKLFYGIEVNGVLCGYAEYDVSTVDEEGRTLTRIETKSLAMLSALGMGFDTKVALTYEVDPATGRFVSHTSEIDQGKLHLESVVHVDGDTVRFAYPPGEERRNVAVPPDVVLENTLWFPHLIQDFADPAVTEKTYDVLEVRDAAVQKTTYSRVGTEELKLAGRTYTALVLDELNLKTGLKIKWWLDPETGRMLKTVPMGNRLIYLADASVAKRIKTADLDELIMSKVDVAIPDFTAITYMKVKAEMEPAGLWVTREGLNVPGQAFTGTVAENLVDGVFEIEHPRYDGTGAPPFPPPAYPDGALKEYLEPSAFVESGDPVLAAKARAITEGSKDAWEAATRITRWVAEEITYAIPGGGTARKTYDMRAGECGAHSVLVASFCRAVGIPARVVWGCMYTPTAGGGFGQHAWNEIYMGDAGWIPVDATAFETDYVDSGHIRFGTMQSLTIALNAHGMEVLDHRLRAGDAGSAARGDYDRYVGQYRNVEAPPGSKGLGIVVQNNSLALDIPDRMALALNDPDEEGYWVCTASPRLFVEFEEDDAGRITGMKVHEIIIMSRTAEEEAAVAADPGEVPEEYQPYLGTYHFAALKADFRVSYEDGRLAVYDPLGKRTVGLQPPDETGWRVDEFGKNRIRFDAGDDGTVVALKLDSISALRRK